MEPIAAEHALDACGGPVVGSFSGSTTVELPVPCSFDFNLAATKYFAALEADDVPLCLLFSGTMFYAGETGALEVAGYFLGKRGRLPAAGQRLAADDGPVLPHSVWLRVPRDVFERLQQFKLRQGLSTSDQALERLLPAEPSAIERQAVP